MKFSFIAAFVALVFFATLSCGIDEGIGAEDIVENVCEQVEQVNSFDVTVHLTNLDDGTVSDTATITNQIYGEDYYSSIVDGTGQIHEAVRVGGVNASSYIRQPDEKWQMLDISTRRSLSFPYKIEKGCPDLTGFNYVGEEEIDNEILKRYNASRNSDSGTGGMWDLFVDADGLLVQAEKVESFQTADGVSQLRQRAVFSEIGEPNTITLPAEITRSISTHTPTPTPTVTPTPVPGTP